MFPRWVRATRRRASPRSAVKSVAVAADVGDADQVERAIGEATAALGRIDILVNNAGIDTTSPVVSMPLAMWDDMIRVNLRSVFLCSQAVLPGMIEREVRPHHQHRLAARPQGRAGDGALRGGQGGRPRLHPLARLRGGAGQHHRQRHLPGADRHRSLPGDPGGVAPAQDGEVPLGRPGTVDEIAPTALLLAADDGAYYVGASLNPNGGDVMI